MDTLQTRTRCLTALALFLLPACGNDSTAPPQPAVASVAVAPSASSLTVGDTAPVLRMLAP